ncbi:steroid receptor RNA activator 1-like [Planococcus citri]|uniref:steroid receptor RNA activator 1-like n=1 Tax=Planococcus citri TaxID=170843 RepID=UPI0031F9FDC6
MKSSQDAGWNDPPKFSYNESIELTRSPKRNVLNKRVAFPLSSTSSKSAAPFLDPTAPPSNNPNLPPPPSIFSCPSEPNSDKGLNERLPDIDNLDISKEKPEESTNERDDDVTKVDVNEIISSLEIIIEEKRKFLTDNRDELIKKKLQIMKDSWESNKISEDIKKQISELTNALKENNKEKANRIQVALMVDHPKLCSEFISVFRLLINADESDT